MEFLSRNPDVVQADYAFSDAVVAQLSTLGSIGNGDTKIEGQIDQKLESLTGLHIKRPEASSPVQLVSHLPGGHSDIVVDSVSFLTAIHALGSKQM